MADNKDYWEELRDVGFDEDLFNDIFENKSGESIWDDDLSEGMPEIGSKLNQTSEPVNTPEDTSYAENSKSGEKGGLFDKLRNLRDVDNLEDENVKSFIPGKNRNPRQGSEDDFELDYDFDSEYQDAEEEEELPPIHRSRERRTGCLGGILYFIFILAVSMLLACAGWVAATDVLALGKTSGELSVTVPENFEMNEVTDMLYENGLIKYKSLFNMYAKYSHADEKIDAGTYVLNTNYDYRALVTGMTTAGGTKVEVDVTIPEGFNMDQIFTLLETTGVCSKDKLYKTAASYDFGYDFLENNGDALRLEGFLFPDTYTFYMSDRPERVISKLLANFNNKFNEEYRGRAAELGYSVRDIVVVASMIEKEAGNDEERADIASVIYNRLKSSNFPHLQIDATIYYAMSLTGEEFSTDLNSPYNTYVCEGLPVGPISNPGAASIFAALYPETTSYYYYALGKDNAHQFFKNQNAFLDFVNSDAYGG